MRYFRALLFAMVGLMLTIVITAQNFECPAIVEQALDIVTQACVNNTGRNQVCYGNFNLSAEPQIKTNVLMFEAPGDIIAINKVMSLNVEPMSIDNGTWGIALMQIQANLPDTIPGRNVTFLMFGDVELVNAGAVTTTRVPITANSPINVRAQPSTEGAIIGGLVVQQSVDAIGRNADGTWVLIDYDNGQRGWVFAELVTLSVDMRTLEVIDMNSAESSSQYAPMQSVYFNTGSIGQANCNEVPPSGVLIQTPEGVSEVTLVLNEVVVTLGSTAFVQAEAGGEFTLDLIEGEATMLAEGELIIIPAGSRGSVPMNDDLSPAGVPVGGLTYNDLLLDALPISLLEREFEPQAALSEDEIDTVLNDLTYNMPGTWEVTYGVGSLLCDARDIQFNTATGTIVFAEGGGTLNTNFGGWINGSYSSGGDGTYTVSLNEPADDDSDGLDYNSTLRIIGAGAMIGTISGRLYNDTYSCSIDNTFALTRMED